MKERQGNGCVKTQRGLEQRVQITVHKEAREIFFKNYEVYNIGHGI